ncbi:MAG: 3-dehydroquinate synthase [Clostridia bacterium]|nr:3-dehydroquinate synthase [Clostridia bacterium]
MIINVDLKHTDYNIYIERGNLNKAGELLNLNRKVLVVTDEGVPQEYAEKVASQCKEGIIITVPQGENSKSIEVYEKLLLKMLECGFTRKDCVAAVGGGVCGDLAGFVASSFMRGVDFYNIPTTVLSQVDSSIGGKVAVNLGGIKNIVGAFYQPKAVLIDPETLKTLPSRQVSAGLAEAVKMALTFDKELFEKIEASEAPMDMIDEIIAGSLLIKKKVVQEDEKESGLRKVLNFGHTVGHAIESVAHGSLYHGECVALGMLAVLEGEIKERAVKVLESLSLPTSFKADKEALIEAVSHDKKAGASSVTVIICDTAGAFKMQEESLAEISKRMEQFFL